MNYKTFELWVNGEQTVFRNLDELEEELNKDKYQQAIIINDTWMDEE